jgi:hypothetical protein
MFNLLVIEGASLMRRLDVGQQDLSAFQSKRARRPIPFVGAFAYFGGVPAVM